MKQLIRFVLQLIILLGLVVFLTFANISYSHAQNVTDAEGNIYPTVRIGNQVWMARNLITTTLNDGQEISLVEDNTTWHKLKEPGYCWYNNSEKLYRSNGALYNWHAVNTGKLCPVGWRVPTIRDWDVLFDYLGGKDIAGSKMKSTNTSYWNRIDPNATNESGFNGLPSGYRSTPGSYHGSSTSIFLNNGETGYWWSSSELNSINAWYIALSRGFKKVIVTASTLNLGHSVRCIKIN